MLEGAFTCRAKYNFLLFIHSGIEHEMYAGDVQNLEGSPAIGPLRGFYRTSFGALLPSGLAYFQHFLNLAPFLHVI